MNTKRSYLDRLNASGQRRPLSPLDQLDQSLQALEEQIGRGRDAGDPRHPSDQPSQPAQHFEQSYRSIARDIDRMRGQEEGIAAAGKIANELRGLRDELRHQMSSGFHEEFESLREDIAQAYQSMPATHESAELGREFERLSGAIQTLADKSDDRSIAALRLEVEQVRGALDTLAREESVQAVDRRFEDFDRRWSAHEPRPADRDDDRAIAMLSERLEQIGTAVNNLPESLSLRSLEEKVRTLAAAVDHFVSQEAHRSSETLAMIDERLDEISRAIVASTVAAQANSLDPEALERIEKRIGSLAAQIEEVAADRPGNELIERLNALTARVDELAVNADLPQQAMEKLSEQIALIADKIDRAPAMPDADALLQVLEQRFELLSEGLDRRQGDALGQHNLLFQDLEKRLDEVAAKLDQPAPAPQIDSDGIMNAIDARFTALAQRLEDREPHPATSAAINGLESRLEDISSRLDVSAAHFASIDPDLIRSLEAQVTGLSAHLAKPGTPLPEFEDITPRLGEIEKSLAATQEAVVIAAREAAENAVRALAGSSEDRIAVSDLAEDLKTLEALTRRSDERNSKTFEAIHDTLLKIVDRLGSLDLNEPGTPAEPKITVRDVPPMDLDEASPLDEGMATLDAMPPVLDRDPVVRTPAQAAAAAAMAALGTGQVSDKPDVGTRKKSMLGGLARAFSRKEPKQAEEPTLAGSVPVQEMTAVNLDAPLDPVMANQPLEPGSGAPDLNAIMKRVRDERSQPAKPGASEASHSDFIAAARRAAQAAAAEADAQKRQSSLAGPVRALRIGDLFKSRRKPLLMGTTAVALALAGSMLGKAYLTDPEQTASVEAPSTPATQKAGSAEAKVDTAADANEPARVVGKNDLTPAKPMLAANPMALDQSSSHSVAPAPLSGGAYDQDDGDIAKTNAGFQAVDPISQTPAKTSADTTGAIPPVASTDPAAASDVPAAIGPAALRDAAAAGDAKAMFEIGTRFAEAHGVQEDMTAAATWYEKSANLGFAPAEYRIGNFYEKGIGVKRDIQKAKTWYQLAAGQGNASAMHNLAVLFAMAADGVTDNESAARWFQAAADLGVKDSQFNLGILAAKGVGMKQNLEEAYKWFSLVANTGDKDATAKRDEIADALRPEQLERARSAATLWKAKPVVAATNSIDIPESWQDGPVTTTSSIDMKKAVQNIQRILKKNGYEVGDTDGVMGQKTKNAIMAFQGDNDLQATGEVDEKLVKALLAKK